MRIAIYPYSQQDGAFSAPGDSGSVVADGNGRIIGILTGGAGKRVQLLGCYLCNAILLDRGAYQASVS